MNRKICVVTGSRAEFGLLRCLMQNLKSSTGIELQVIATGMHLSPEFGLTYREIEEAGFSINAKVEMLMSSNTSSSTIKSVGIGLIGFADAYERLRPDLIIVLGDRFEIFASVTAAMLSCIPVAHLHGGEITEGAFDDAIRHSITKMSHMHFVANEEYMKRVIQLGESPSRVFLVGGLGVDAIKHTPLLGQSQLENSLGFKFGKKNLLVTFHPTTLDNKVELNQQMINLLTALDELEDTNLIFTLSNADPGGHDYARLLFDFADKRTNVKVYKNLGHLRYLSCMKYVDAVVGNSSSGLTEAPTMGVATLNIGDRQKGRLFAKSVVNCSSTLEGIRCALKKVYDKSFRESLSKIVNPYGDGGASERIFNIIKTSSLDGIIKKTFFDICNEKNCENYDQK